MKYNNKESTPSKMEKELYSQYARYQGDTVGEKWSLLERAFQGVIEEDTDYAVKVANAENEEERMNLILQKLSDNTLNFDFDF